MKKVYYRTRQFIFSRVLRLFEHICPKIIDGEDTILDVYKILKENSIKNVFIITTKGTIKRKTLEPFFETLVSNNIKYYVFYDVTPDPTIECVEQGLKLYLENKCEGLVCVGGGSVIDCGKVIAARSVKPNKQVPSMKGLLKINHKLPLFIAVPTTAGTGSEVTAAAVVTDVKNGTHYKYAISDFSLIPSHAILDPKLTLSLPPRFSVTTGYDALTHAFEAYTNLFASEYVKKNALEAIKLLMENINVVAKEPENIEARRKMLLGSTYAGIAFTNNFVGYVHALAHGIGGIYGVSHSEANTVLLTPVLRYYGKAIYKPMAEICDYLGLGGTSEKEKYELVLNKLDEIKTINDIEPKFDCLLKKDYKELVDRAISEGNPSYPCPLIFKRKDFENVLDSVLGQKTQL